MKNFLYNLATDKSKGWVFALPKLLLLLLSFVYGAVIRSLIFIRSSKARSLKCKVISVGNITLGGTGKTSLVKEIAHLLKEKKHKVAVISRGYKKLNMSMGDEPEMLLKSLGGIPVIVDKDRYRGANRATQEYGVDAVIFDDGFQQWGIKKDLEILAVNSLEGFGNRQMLPRGLLREPLSRISRAHIFVLTKTDLVGGTGEIKKTIYEFAPEALIVESVHKPIGFFDPRKPGELINVNNFKASRVALFSGIGDPGSFSDLIKGLGIKVNLELAFGDHHNYSDDDLIGIINKAQDKGLNIIVTTEKDAARLSEDKLKFFKGYQLLVLRIELEIVKNEGAFLARLFSLYSI
jgi:tetraacyldisaccharide 4'-kinase